VSDPFAPAPTPAPAPVPTAEPVAAQPPVVVSKPVKKQNRSGSILLAAAGVVAIAGIAFAAGRLTAPAAAAAGNGSTGGGRFGGFPGASFVPGQGFPGRGGPNGQAGAFGALTGGGISLQGQVTAVSSTSITVKLANGSDVTVPLDSSTTYHQANAATSSAVTVGTTVDVAPGAANFTPGASQNPAASGAPGFGGLSFGPATDVTVVSGGTPAATAAP
jgi:hypothetical protein